MNMLYAVMLQWSNGQEEFLKAFPTEELAFNYIKNDPKHLDTDMWVQPYVKEENFV